MNKRIQKKKRKQYYERLMKSIPEPYAKRGITLTVERILEHRTLMVFTQRVGLNIKGPYKLHNLVRVFRSVFRRNKREWFGCSQPTFNYVRFVNSLDRWFLV